MENLQIFLLVLQIIIAVLLIILVLVQKSDGDSLSGIGGGSGGLNSVISSKSSANFLTKATMILAGFFMLNCLVLALISSKITKSSGMEIDKVIEQQNKSGEAPLDSVSAPSDKK
ncbi:MAG: preprotein translocase subunit SecG [Rickettsiaceae bacterium]|jgi:preprotein translocase subunit SecG|nr:preprotein translocase subunit SecG [Rickettsiaceae bacterium]